MNDKFENIEEMLLRYCEGSLNDEENRQVEEWITSDNEHEDIARNIHELYWAADTLHVMNKVDTEKALKNINGSIYRKRLRTVFLWAERIAAILFLPLLSAYLLQYQTNSSGGVETKPNMMEIRTNLGMTTSFVLPDGTKVYLNSGSVIRYPNVFSDNKREVELLGEAFFDVTKNPEKRFIVKTSCDKRVEVFGTSFNMEAFPGDSLLSTTLLEGKVKFCGDNGCVEMLPGEKLVYNVNTSKAKMIKTDGEVETAWRDGKIIFDDTPFDEALRMISKRFNVDFVIKNGRYHKDSFTGTFTTQQLEQVLGVFSISSKIKWRYLPTTKSEDKRSIIEVY